MEAGYWRDLLRPVVAGRRIILTGMPVGGAGDRVGLLRNLGAGHVYVIGDGMGTGPLPDCEWMSLDVSAPTMMEAIRAGQAALAALPADAMAALDRFDPHRHALVIGTFLNELPDVAGRPCLSWRKPEWVALEDKVVVDALWDAVGVERAPSRVVAVDDLQPEVGVVWAGDARDGFHGGAELTRWIRTEDDAAAALVEMHAHCNRVRVMPFLEGIPCSIHGMVFPDFVATFRPVEMVALRRGSEFFYAGAATYWDPPDANREGMRAIARRVGDHLRSSVDFRGAFTIDGVMTADGFRPTELNPRLGAGLNAIARGASDIPIDLLHQALMAGIDLDYQPEKFEQLVVETADAKRGGGTWRAVPTALETQEHRALAFVSDQWEFAAEDATPDAFLDAGPSNIGGFLRVTFMAARTPAGPSVGPRAAAFYAFADEELGTSIGPLYAAEDVRRA
jgi:hypothetical protein